MTSPGQTVGANLRRLRLARGLSLVELGRLSGLAKGTLTQLEAGRANPTIDTLQSLAGALAAGLTDLVAEPPLVRPEVVRHDEGPITEGRTLRWRLLNRSHLGSMIAETFALRLGAGSMHHAQSHALGVVEQIYVLSGTVEIGPDEHTALLQPGDFARFPADRPHSYGAPDVEAHALVWQFLPTLPVPAATMPDGAGAIGAVEGLVARDPAPAHPLESFPPRVLPQPPVRGRRPPSRTVPGPTPGRPIYAWSWECPWSCAWPWSSAGSWRWSG
ncbi:XRE family transcriptional regulator, partial [Patulibacter sp. NPDC049589]|uniref:helix-turn-helix domain-containing protein n=1 Tax=Patulibacter sp. NPDC049589 TaxID=3154731 RepID=UPI00342299FE